MDVCCGPGHMLQRYRDRYDADRPLVRLDLSAAMVSLTNKRLGAPSSARVGDMRHPDVSMHVAAVINYFALHHLNADSARGAFATWFALLQPRGQLLVATWEGKGAIDYGDQTDVVALRYTREQVRSWADDAGFTIDRYEVKPVDEIPMDAVYLEATRPG